jgi:hypothetical protein
MKKNLYVILFLLATLGMACQSKDHQKANEGYGAGEFENNNADVPTEEKIAELESPVNIQPDNGVVGLDSAEMDRDGDTTSAQDPAAGRATSITENNAGTSQTRGKENNSPSRQMPQTNKPQKKQ